MSREEPQLPLGQQQFGEIRAVYYVIPIARCLPPLSVVLSHHSGALRCRFMVDVGGNARSAATSWLSGATGKCELDSTAARIGDHCACGFCFARNRGESRDGPRHLDPRPRPAGTKPQVRRIAEPGHRVSPGAVTHVTVATPRCAVGAQFERRQVAWKDRTRDEGAH